MTRRTIKTAFAVAATVLTLTAATAVPANAGPFSFGIFGVSGMDLGSGR